MMNTGSKDIVKSNKLTTYMYCRVKKYFLNNLSCIIQNELFFTEAK